MATGAQTQTITEQDNTAQYIAPTNDILSQLNGTIANENENQNPNYSNGNNPNHANHEDGSKRDDALLNAPAPPSTLAIEDSTSNPFTDTEDNDDNGDNDNDNTIPEPTNLPTTNDETKKDELPTTNDETKKDETTANNNNNPTNTNDKQSSENGIKTENNDSNNTINNSGDNNEEKEPKKQKNYESNDTSDTNGAIANTNTNNTNPKKNKNTIDTETETNTMDIIDALISGDIEEQKHNNNNNNSNNNKKKKGKNKNKRKQKRLSQRNVNSNNINVLAPQNGTKTSDIDKAIQSLLSCSLKMQHRKEGSLAGHLNMEDIVGICLQAKKICYSQPMLLEVDCPINIVGDVHGQYPDLIHLFELAGLPPESNYLFLGDYVDRGGFSLETITLLLAYKVKYKDQFFLLRGNHECASINRLYGFFHECKQRFPKTGTKMWRRFTDVFNCLPVAAIIDEKIFCMHGGLSPSIKHMDDIRKLQRPTDVPDSGILCDLLWADPEPGVLGWGPNDRGVSYTFGSDVLARFLQVHDMDLVCRAHQVVEDGYEFFGSRCLVTIFSAPNYCGEFDNAGAIMAVDDSLMCSFHILKPKPVKRTRFY